MCWRPNSAAPNSTEGAYSTPQSLLAGFEGPLHDGEGKRKGDAKEMESERKKRGRKSRRDERDGAGVNRR